MKIVRLFNNRVAEIIPETATPVSKWYGEFFASQCVEAPDEVECGWYYDSETKTFSEYEPTTPVEPDSDVTTDDILNALLGVTPNE